MLPLWVTTQCGEGALGDLPWAMGGLPGTSRKARYRCSQLERGSDSETSASDCKCQKTCWSNLHQGGYCGYCQYQTRVNTRQCLVHKIVQLLTCMLRRFGNGMFLEVKWTKATQTAGRNNSCSLQLALQVQGKTSLQTAADALFNALLFGVDATWKLKIPCRSMQQNISLERITFTVHDFICCIYHMPLSHV